MIHAAGRALAASAIVLLSLTSCRDDEPAETEPTSSGAPTPVPAAATTWAPLVYLSDGEEYEPGDASVFIRHAKLRWAHDGVCGDNTIAEPPEEKDLATPNRFRERKRNTRGCAPYGPYYTTTQLTRPYANEELGAEGFYLHSQIDRHAKGGPDPVYVQHVPGEGENAGMTGYVYWFFYPWNESAVPGGGHGGNHEGDWERITVVTRGDEPLRVVYSQHNTKCAVDWSEVDQRDGHPIVYSARGSHGSYQREGAYSIPDLPFPDEVTPGQEWRTWERVREVEREQWWGYGGGWGDVGAPIKVWELGKHQTGPAGPMPPALRDMRPEVFSTTPCPDPLTPTATPGPSPTATQEPPSASVPPDQYQHSSGDQEYYYFKSPDDQYTCAIDGDMALCQGETQPLPPRPDTCHEGISWGYGMYVDSLQEVDFLCAGGLIYSPADQAPGGQDRLPLGRTITALGFTCSAEESGIRCTHDASGHGFHITPDTNERF